MVKQYGQLYLDTRHALLETEDAQTAGMMARQLLCHFSGKSPEAILADRDLYASEQVCRDMSRAVRRLLDGEPLAYVLGEWEFYGMPLKVDRDVLIPRDDTVAVAELAIHYGLFLSEKPRILDLCTGTLSCLRRTPTEPPNRAKPYSNTLPRLKSCHKGKKPQKPPRQTTPCSAWLTGKPSEPRARAWAMTAGRQSTT